MQRASDSIGALAAALARAQTLLTNPEKSLVATIREEGRHGREQTFRYAPLSSGLEIVRKVLGQHEIATVQTHRLIDPPDSSISPQCWRTRRGSGLPPIGLCARSVKLPPAAHGGRTHLCTKICAFCAGRDCRRG